jgi:hypothetical protein
LSWQKCWLFIILASNRIKFCYTNENQNIIKRTFVLIAFVLVFITCKKDITEVEKLKNPSTDFMEYTNQGKIASGGGKVQIIDTGSTIKNASVEIAKGSLTAETNISISIPSKKYYFGGDST